MIESNFIYPQKYKLLTIYKISVVILFLTSLNPWFFWGIPKIIITLLCGIVSLIFYVVNQNKGRFVNKRMSILLLLLAFLATSRGLSFFGVTNQLFVWVNFYVILSLKDSLKISLIDFVTKCFSAIVLISLCFYFLKYVFGIPLQSSVVVLNDIDNYTYNNYKFFLTLHYLESMLLPRFQSVFIEPGHLGMISSFLLYVFSFDLRKWYNVVLLVCSLLTFSLAAYVLIALGIILKTVTRMRTIVIGSILFVLSGFAIYQVATTYNGGDNLINNMIVLRLAIEEGDMAGNNRTTDDFDQEFNRSIKDPVNLIFGKHFDLDRFGWGNTSYTTFIYTYGLFGLFWLILLYFSFNRGYSSSNFIRLLFLFSASFLQRPYAMWTSQLIIFICGLALLENNRKSINKQQNIPI